MAALHRYIPSPFGAPLPACYVHDVHDVLFMLSGWYHGVIPLCTRHLSTQEKSTYITSGWTVVFPSVLSKVTRWRDQYFWSTSRIVGPFFLYRQLQEPGRPARNKTTPRRRRAAVPPPPPQLSPEDEEAWDNTEFDWWIVGTNRSKEKLTRGGFCRKSITIQLFGSEYRVVSYYSPLDAQRGLLPRASEHEKLAGLGIHPAILNGARCKMSSRTLVKCHALSEWLSQASDQVDSASEMSDSSDMESEDPLYGQEKGQDVPADVTDEVQSDECLVEAERDECLVEAEREECVILAEMEDDECLFDAHDGDVEIEDSLFDATDDTGSEDSIFDPCDAKGVGESRVAVPLEDVAYGAAPVASLSTQTATHDAAFEFEFGAHSVPALVDDVDSAVLSDSQAHVHSDIFDCQVRQASPADVGDLLSPTSSQPEVSSASGPSTTGVCSSCGQPTIVSQATGNSSANHHPAPESEPLTVAQFLNKFFADYDFGVDNSLGV